MLRRMPRALCVLALGLILACDSSAAKVPTQADPDKIELPSGERGSEKFAEHDEAAIDKKKSDSTPAPPPAPKPRGTFQRAPERSCAFISREPVNAPEGHATLTSQGDALSLWLGYKEQRTHRLARLRVPDGAIEATTDVPTAVLAAPSVIADGQGGFHVGLITAPHAASWVHFAVDGKAELKALSSEADTRFRPALARTNDSLLIAYTRPVKAAMHVEVARISADGVASQDVTPVSHGGSAPTFVLGAKNPRLVMIDARAGVSPLLEVAFDDKGQAQPAIVRTPVSQPYSPSELWAVEVPEHGVEVAFTALGKLAATAIGRVPLRTAAEPVPLLPSLGYGQLRLAAVSGPRGAVFVLQSPNEAKAQATLHLEVVVLDAKGEGPRFKLEGVTSSAAPSIVALGTPGQFALLHRASSGWELVRLVCDA
jgi:hypothetical protein